MNTVWEFVLVNILTALGIGMLTVGILLFDRVFKSF